MTPFERDLHSSAAFRSKCQDDDFACKLYCSLENQEWVKDHAGVTLVNSKDRMFSCSFRYAGGLVADLRDKGEDYMDFYCCWGGLWREGADVYQMATVYPEVEEALTDLGWYPVKADKETNERQRHEQKS